MPARHPRSAPRAPLPAGFFTIWTTVAIDLETSDVIHSFWVPGFFTKRDMIPNADNVLVVETTKVGHFRGYCAEYCGVDHARMLFDVEIVDQAAYDRWRREQAGATS